MRPQLALVQTNLSDLLRSSPEVIRELAQGQNRVRQWLDFLGLDFYDPRQSNSPKIGAKGR